MIKRALLVTLLPLFAACVAQSGTATDTNTNWLDHCSEDDECGTGLACLCGICTLECDNTKDCRQQDEDAICVTRAICAEATSICGKASDEEPGPTEASATESAASEEVTEPASDASASDPDPEQETEAETETQSEEPPTPNAWSCDAPRRYTLTAPNCEMDCGDIGTPFSDEQGCGCCDVIAECALPNRRYVRFGSACPPGGEVACDLPGEQLFEDDCGCGCETVTPDTTAVPEDECLAGLETADAYLQSVILAAETICYRDATCSAVSISPSCAGSCARDVAVNAETADTFEESYRESWLNSCAAIAACGFNVNCVEQAPSESRCQFPAPGPGDDFSPGTCTMVPLDDSCEGLTERADRKLVEDISRAQLGCQQDDDCQDMVSPGLSCILDAGDCGERVPIYTARVAELEAAVQQWEATICSPFVEQECAPPKSDCQEIPPPGPREVICLLGAPDAPEKQCVYATTATEGAPAAP